MLEFLSEFIERISDYLWEVLSYGVMLVKAFWNIIEVLLSFTASISSFFIWLPDEVSVYIVIAFTVAFLYKVLGREG